jgi:hypothetical protein
MLRIFLARCYRRGNLRRKTWHDPLSRPCLSAAATPLRRATSVTFAPLAPTLLDDPRLVILRPAPPPL